MKCNHKYTGIIPSASEGINTKTSSSINCNDPQQASLLFQKGKKRLLDINHWDTFSGKMSSSFRLTDSNGKLVNGEAKEGYHIRIDIPAPGTVSGDGYDWVEIERIEDCHKTNSDVACLAIKVRPSENPLIGSSQIAHFFKSHATSTFLVQRKGLKITCTVIGRNEKPNTNQKNPWDKIRNFFIALTAFLGFSKLQWKYLTKGILTYSGNEK